MDNFQEDQSCWGVFDLRIEMAFVQGQDVEQVCCLGVAL